MLKSILAVVFTALFTVSAFAAGPSQIWRLEINRAAEGIVEVSEIELRTAPGGTNATELFRNFTFEESAPAGSASWAVNHMLGIQWKQAGVDIIAYAVDVVAPGDYFYNSDTDLLNVREVFAYAEVEFTAGGTAEKPATPEVGDIFRDTDLVQFERWDGAAWVVMTVTTTTDPLPAPDTVEADTVTWTPGTGLPATGGPARNDLVTIDFPQAVVGAATVIGATFDVPSSGNPGTAVPVIEHWERRAAAAAFDGNKASWFKSKRGPTDRSPVNLQYTYWVGDPTRYPTIVEYTITARKAATAPEAWTLYYWDGAGWAKADQQAGMRFEDGETKILSIQ